MKYVELLNDIAEVHLLQRSFEHGATYMFTGRALVILHLHDFRRKLDAAKLSPYAAVDNFLDGDAVDNILILEVLIKDADMAKPGFVEHVKKNGFIFRRTYPGGVQRYMMRRLPTENLLILVNLVPDAKITPSAPTALVALKYGGSWRDILTVVLTDIVERATRHMVRAHSESTTPEQCILEDLRMLALAQDHVERNRPELFGVGPVAWRKEITKLMSQNYYTDVANALRQAVSEEPGQLAKTNADAETLALGSHRQEVLRKEWNDALDLLMKRFSEPYDVANMRPREHIVRNRHSFPNIDARGVLARR